MFIFTTLLLFFVTVFLTKLIKYHLSRRKLYKFASQLQGPLALPFIGSAWLLSGKSEDVFDKLEATISRHSPTSKFWMGPQLIIIFSDLKHVESVLTSTKLTYKSRIYDLLYRLGGNGLITASGPRYRQHRKLIQPLLHAKYVENSFSYLQKHLNVIVNKLEKHINDGYFDILHEIHYCLFDFIGEIIHGVKTNCQIGETEEVIRTYTDTYDNVFSQMYRPWLYPDIIFNMTSLKRERDRLIKIVDNFSDEIIRSSNARTDSKEYTQFSIPLLDGITHQLKKDANLMTHEEYRHHIVTLFAASEDTISITAAMCCVCFGMYPEYQEKAAKEIFEIYGDKPKEVLFDDLPKLKYLEMCIKEVLRIQCIAPYILRRTTEDTKICEYDVPKNCEILIPINNIHRNPKDWKKPNEFYPDHFLPEAIEVRRSFAYIPFSTGPRGCIGKNLAMQTLKLFMASLLQRFRFEAKGKFSDIKFKSDISVRPIDGYNVKIFKRIWN